MQGLAVLHQHVVGHVDHVVDAAKADRFKTLDQPGGGWGDLHPAKQAGRVPWAELGIEDLDRGVVSDVARGRNAGQVGQSQFGTRGRGDLPGQADVAEAVRAIGGDLDVEHNVGVGFVKLRFHLEPDVGQQVRQFVGGDRDVDVVGQPVQRDIHRR